MMDNASSEYIFDLEFFAPPKSKSSRAGSTDAATSAFNEVFDGTLKLISVSICSFLCYSVGFCPHLPPKIQQTTKQYTEQSYDCLGILLCIRINNQNIRIMQKRRIPVLEAFMMQLNMVLWPRFQGVVDLHVDRYGVS